MGFIRKFFIAGCMMLSIMCSINSRTFRMCNMTTGDQTLTGYPDWWYYDNTQSFNVVPGTFQDVPGSGYKVKGVCYSFDSECNLGDSCGDSSDDICNWGKETAGFSATYVYGIGDDYEGWASVDWEDDDTPLSCQDAGNQVLLCQDGNYATEGSECGCPTQSACASDWDIIACALACLFANSDGGGDDSIVMGKFWQENKDKWEDMDGGFKRLTYKNGNKTIRLHVRKRKSQKITYKKDSPTAISESSKENFIQLSTKDSGHKKLRNTGFTQ